MKDISYLSILIVSIPAIFLNIALQVGNSFITAFCGHRGVDTLASYSTVTTSFTFALSLFNFLTSVVISQVGLAIGKKDFKDVGKRVRCALLTPIVLGIICGIFLFGSKSGVYWLLKADDDIKKIGDAFYDLRIAILPFQLMVSAITGVLCGYQRLFAAVIVNVTCAAVDVIGNYCVFYVLNESLAYSAVATGLGNAVAVVIGLILIAKFPPVGSNGEVFVFSSPPSEGESPLLRSAGDLEKDSIDESSSSSKGLMSFFSGSLNTIIRSLVLQGTMFLLAIVAAQLSKEALAAHQVILQLWMICSYFCDGFGTFANMYGSKFIGQAKYHKFHRLSRRMAGFAITIGIAACFLILTFKSQIMNIFIHQDDVETRRYLNQAWLLVGIVQPINAMVFVYDGLLFAANSFAFARNVLISGFFMFVGPMLFYAKEQDQTGLFLIWASNGALSFWRMGASLYHVHVSLLICKHCCM
eukprot:TRINITY_DN676758_c0_g1_i2.p1 TRINITY_DN676758_c0_g1~~TRINITY_DN676758_c0_g1_i2.p1  ORF type:complete len:500 (-),score=124.88 TRINITY_DN676758_c0_g1_i2:68-1477(-)